MVDLNINLPESFFQEEERDGYLVSAKTKELWAVQLDLLCELDRVCKKYNLKYVLDFGSLLGAVRHKGFIPWDEDIDVSMLREDHDKLLEVGPKEFKHPYFLQTYETDPYYDGGVTRIRRSDTTYLQGDGVLHRTKCNHGIHIDVFVFDNVPSGDVDKAHALHLDCNRVFFRGVYNLAHPLAFRYGKKLPERLVRYAYAKLKYGTVTNAYRQIDKIATQFGDSDYVCCLVTPIDTWCRPRKWFEDIIYVPLENMMFPIPADYDAVLTQRYGDYMKPVVDTTMKVWMVDTSCSYADVIKEKDFYKKLLDKLGFDYNGNKIK